MMMMLTTDLGRLIMTSLLTQAEIIILLCTGSPHQEGSFQYYYFGVLVEHIKFTDFF